jgi:hypothetical protein
MCLAHVYFPLEDGKTSEKEKALELESHPMTLTLIHFLCWLQCDPRLSSNLSGSPSISKTG